MKPVTDRRSHVRSTCRIEATAVLDEGLTRLSAMIVDITPAGARLEVPEEVDLPRRFYMLFGYRIAPCRLVWRDGLAAGIAYQE